LSSRATPKPEAERHHVPFHLRTNPKDKQVRVVGAATAANVDLIASLLDVLRIEDGLITEIVVFPPDSFPLFRLPILMDPAPVMNMRH
jgi:hypothetical protein